MSFNESTVEDAALEWFGELGYSCLGAEALTPSLSHGKREKEEDRNAIRRLNPANAFGNPHPASPKRRGVETRATLRKFRIVHIERSLKP